CGTRCSRGSRPTASPRAAGASSSLDPPPAQEPCGEGSYRADAQASPCPGVPLRQRIHDLRRAAVEGGREEVQDLLAALARLLRAAMTLELADGDAARCPRGQV